MSASNHPTLRKLLRSVPDGLTAKQLSTATNLSAQSVRNALAKMPDVYIDRWTQPKRGQHTAVWCAVEVPENCPKPTKD